MAIDCLEKGFRPSILATDISTKVLGTARSGIYPRERTRMMPRHLLRRYFQKGQGQWEDFIRVKEEVRRMVTFGRFNLVTDPLPSRKFDVIFCRNVLIYFDSRVKEQVINRLYGLLKGHGYFIIGGAESLSNLQNGFQYIKPSIYRKRGRPGSFD